MDNIDLTYIKGAAEALLFVSDKPVMMDQFKDVLEGVEPKVIRQALEELQASYAERKSGMIITEIAGGYQMLSNPDYAVSIRAFYKTQKKEKLSKPALEALAIIAYKQPVTRVEVEMIRGVNSDGVVNHLAEKSLIKIAGRKDVPGKPYLYGTTKEFLEYFGLRSLADLPKLEEFVVEGEEGTPKIEAFQQVTEQFKEQVEKNAPEEIFSGAAETPDINKIMDEEESAPEEEKQQTAENLQDENEQTTQENHSASEEKNKEAAFEGGSHEHPQAS